MAQAAAERCPHDGDLRCERRRQGSLPDDKSTVLFSSNTAADSSYIVRERRGDVNPRKPEGGGSPSVVGKERLLRLLRIADQQQLTTFELSYESK
jgi:hypothetical protein